MQRFNQLGLSALSIAAGRGRKPTYTSQQRQRVLEELRREPDREQDQSATWSLSLLERALRKRALPNIGASTIRRVLTRGRLRVWEKPNLVPDGYSFARAASAGAVRVYDPQAAEKQRKTLVSLPYC